MARGHRGRRSYGKKKTETEQNKAINRLEKDMRMIMPGIQHKHLVQYNNTGLTATLQNLPVHTFTHLYGEAFVPTPVGVPTAALRENNKIMLKSVSARIQFYPDNILGQQYYQFRCLIVQTYDNPNLGNNDAFELQNFVEVIDPSVAFCYTHGKYRSRLNNPGFGDDCDRRYKILVDKLITMRTTQGDANNAPAASNVPAQVSVGYKWKNGLQIEYANDNFNSGVSNNVMLHIVPSCLLGGARPTCDFIVDTRWNEL